MKFLISVLLIALLSFLVSIFFPWWCIALVAFTVVVIIPQKPLSAFLSGFTAIFILWASLASYISSKNEYLLAHKISLLILKSDSPVLLALISALIGALVAGSAAVAGSYARKPV